MMLNRSIPKLAMLVAVSAVGLTACSDQVSTGAVANGTDVPLKLEVSSSSAARGSRVAIAVNLDESASVAGVVQGALAFDAASLRYVGQSPVGTAISMTNAKSARDGAMRFTAFNPRGISGRVAVFVFEVKAPNYLASVRYVPQMAAATGGRQLSTQVLGTVVNEGLAVPSDAAEMTVADWAARIVPAGSAPAAVSAAPGEYRLNLKYGDIDFNGIVNGNDFLAVANAAVGNDEIISGTDGPTVDRDLVIAGNVFPTNTAGACGTAAGGVRVLDGNDFLAIANFAVGGAETCAGNVIPGRGPLASNTVTIPGGTTLAGGDLPCTGGAVTWSKSNKYVLDGVVRVQSGCTLTIEAGTTVQGNSLNQPSSLYVYRGAKIIAAGTQNEPIVFSCTAAVKVAGCWGGLWISGKARINTASTLVTGDPETGPSADGGCNQLKAEAGNAPGFGGCDDADNSGTLSYVRVEYGGFIVQQDRELNNLTLSAVGSGTQINNVQVYGGLDDGIEFFGGRVNTRYLVSTANNDDGFDTDFGYDGTTQYLIIAPDEGNNVTTPSQDDSRAFETDNANASSTNLPRTNPKIYNATVTGFNVTQDLNAFAAILVRRGASFRMFNSIIDGYRRGLDLRDNNTCLTFGPGSLVIQYTTFTDVLALGAGTNTGPATPCLPGAGTGEAMEASFLSNSTGFAQLNAVGGVPAINTVLFAARDNLLPDYRMRASGALTVPAPNAADPLAPTYPAGVDATTYRGAVGVLSGGQIPWYSGWTRGWTTQSTK